MADNYALREGTGKLTKFRSVELEGGIHLLITGLADADGNLLGDSAAPLPVSITEALPAGSNLIGKVASDTFSTTTLANVSASASNQTLLAANANRKQIVIHNDSTATLLVKFGATASATSYTYKLNGGDTYESPALPIYTGQIDGIWASATGAARITEGT